MKLKVKHFTRVMLVSVVILLCMPIMVSAKENSYDSTSVTTSSSYPYSKVAITPQSSMFATVQITGNKPGSFALQNWQGSNIDTEDVPDVPEADLYYPINVGTDINYQNGYGVSPEWNTYYVNVANNSDKFGDYDVSLTTDRYKIGNGDSVEIQLNTGIIPEVDILVERKGIYQIWHNDVGLALNIVSPSGKSVTPRTEDLPDHQFGGTTLGAYFYFAAFEIGKYKMTFTTGASVVNLRCEYFKTKVIRSGSSISDGVVPGTSEILNPEYQKYVYELDIDLLNYYVYSCNFDFNDPGSSDRRIFYETASACTSTALGIGDDVIYNPIGGSKVYIVIDIPNYFTWASPGVAESGVPKFSLEFNEIKSDRVDLGESEMIVVTQEDFAVGRFIKTRKPGVVSIQFESVGPSSPNLIYGLPYIQEIADNQVWTPQVYDDVYNTADNDSVNVLLSKGTYKFGFYHTGYSGNEYLRLTTAFTELDETSVVVKDPAIDLTPGQFQDISLSGWSNMPDPDGATHGNALLWDIDENFRHYGYNLTFNPTKNGQIFDVNLAPNLEVSYDATATSYTDHTGNASLLIKTTGGTDGDAFIIGSYDKFKGIQVDLGSASDTDAFNWEYRSSGSSWVPFDPSSHDFVDGTMTGSGSLQQSGFISWDPDSASMAANWEPDTTGYSNGLDLYLVRIVCNDSTASVPTVTNFSPKKFVKIEFDMNVEFGFDVGLLGDPFYDQTTGAGDWSNVEVDNAGASVSDDRDEADFGLDYNFNYETAFLFLSTKNMEAFNYNGSSSGVLEELTADMVFSVSIYRDNDWIQQEYKLGKDAPAVHSADVNYTTVPYGHTLTYNASELSYGYVKLLPARRHQFDWTQITMRVTNGTVSGAGVDYYLPWSLDNYAVRSTSLYDYSYTGSAEQYSIEIGFVTEYILMRFDLSATNPDGMVIVELYAGHFGYEMITFNVSGFVWTWYYTVAAVGLGVVVGGVVAFFLIRKKKRGY